MKCQRCNTEITNKQVDLATMFATCPKCQEQSRPWTLPVKRALKDPPKRVSLNASTKQITYTPDKDFSLAFTAFVVWLPPVFGARLYALAQEKLWSLLIFIPFELFFGALTVLTSIGALENLLSKTTIELKMLEFAPQSAPFRDTERSTKGATQIQVKRRVIFTKTRGFSCIDVQQIYCAKRRGLYDVTALYHNGAAEVIVSDVADLESAHFIEAQLEQWLSIKDQAVREEAIPKDEFEVFS